MHFADNAQMVGEGIVTVTDVNANITASLMAAPCKNMLYLRMLIGAATEGRPYK